MTSMALDFLGGNRGRRKQAKPQRKNVDLEDTQTNTKNTQEENINEDNEEEMKKKDIIMCKQGDPDNNHNRIVNNTDIMDERTKNNNHEDCSVIKDRCNDSPNNNEVPNNLGCPQPRLVHRHIQGPPNLETVLRGNGIIKKEKPPVINGTFNNKKETNNSGLQQLLLIENPKRNGDCSPSLKEPKTPVIVVKTISDINNFSDFKPKNGGKRFDGKCEPSEEEKIQEYMKRSDTAVIYQEPVEQQAQVPLSPAAVKAFAEADIGNQDYFIKCPHCQKAYPGFQALRDHIESDHPRNLSPNEALSPVQTSYSPAPVPVQGGLHPCAQCNVTFSTKDQLEKHELLHSPNAQVSCKVCNKQFANVYRLQRHMISHDESAVLRKFKCPECEKAFKFKHHLKEHIRIHSGEKPFECANCGKRFSHSGSYSSHMTSKKCLVMNLKVNRGRGAIGMDKTQINRNIGSGGNKRNITNNNNISSLKGNLNMAANNLNMNASFPSVIPKFGEATAAAFLSAVAPRTNFPTPSAPGLHPFYMATAPSMHLNNSAMHPYMPALSHLLETFAPSNMLMNPKKERDDYKEEKQRDEEDEKVEEVKEESKEEKEEKSEEKDGKAEDDKDLKDRSSPVSNSGGDLEAVKRILETVNATVTKQFLHANMQKFTSSPSGSSCPSVPSPNGEEKKDEELECRHCGKLFQNRIDHHQHERYICENVQKSEGLAAKLEEVASVKREDSMCSGSDDEDAKECDEEIERNEDGGITITTTSQEAGADGRKVRVRSLIADEQLAILKHHYMINPRPKREDLAKIADKIGFPVRVVQVWFQNTRARDRREGRLVQVPYLPLPTLFPNNVPLLHQNLSEQPLDLSTKKSQNSSPESSPQRPASDSDAINLSQKSSSPKPHTFPNGLTIRAMTGFSQYQHSTCPPGLGDFRRTPSPLAYLNLHQEDLKNNTSRLARILSQPSTLSQRLDSNGVSLVPMDRLVFNSELQASGSPLPMVALSLLSQENGSSSPGSDKRSWIQGDLTDETEDSRPHDLDHNDDYSPRKKQKLGDSQSDQEVEGQFICDQCEKAFSKQSSLARHKYEHSGQRPHKCEVCEKAFKHKHHLTEHKRLHSGEKPFQCGKCLKRFSHSGSYSQHMNHRYSYCKPYRD